MFSRSHAKRLKCDPIDPAAGPSPMDFEEENNVSRPAATDTGEEQAEIEDGIVEVEVPVPDRDTITDEGTTPITAKDPEYDDSEVIDMGPITPKKVLSYRSITGGNVPRPNLIEIEEDIIKPRNTIRSQLYRSSVDLLVIVCHLWKIQSDDCIRILIRDSDNIFSLLEIEGDQFNEEFSRGNSLEFKKLAMCRKIIPNISSPLFSILPLHGSDQRFYYVLRFNHDTTWQYFPPNSPKPFYDQIRGDRKVNIQEIKQINNDLSVRDIRVWMTGKISIIRDSSIIFQEEALNGQSESETQLEITILPSFDIDKYYQANSEDPENLPPVVTLSLIRVHRGIIVMDEFSSIEQQESSNSSDSGSNASTGTQLSQDFDIQLKSPTTT